MDSKKRCSFILIFSKMASITLWESPNRNILSLCCSPFFYQAHEHLIQAYRALQSCLSTLLTALPKGLMIWHCPSASSSTNCLVQSCRFWRFLHCHQKHFLPLLPIPISLARRSCWLWDCTKPVAPTHHVGRTGEMALLIPGGLHLVLAGLTVNSWLGAEKDGDAYRNTDFSNSLISRDINWWYRLKDSAAQLECITDT